MPERPADLPDDVPWPAPDAPVADTGPTERERLDAAAAALARLDEIAAPVLSVDVLDVLVDVRAALES